MIMIHAGQLPVLAISNFIARALDFNVTKREEETHNKDKENNKYEEKEVTIILLDEVTFPPLRPPKGCVEFH